LQGCRQIINIAQTERHANGVKGGVVKRQTLRIGQHTRQTEVPLERFTAATSEHGWAKVRCDHLSIVPQVGGKGQGKIGCATADIEETRSRRYAAQGYRLLTPVVVQSKAQDGVEQIIMLGDSGKHLPHSFSHSFFCLFC
jgi:hypothetical protein